MVNGNTKMLNNMKELQKKIFDRLSSKQSLTRSLIYLIIAIIVVLITSYILNKIALKDESCNEMNKILTGENYKPGDLGTLFDVNKTYADPSGSGDDTVDTIWYDKYVMLRNYNIKSSYNSCCANLYKNGWVSECALREVIAQGCRFLDFEVYSYKGNPVVGVSTKVNDYYMKECYNYIPIGIVFDIIYNRAFPKSNSNANAGEQPLIINLRFKTRNKDVLDNVAKSLKNNLKNKLLNSCDSIYNYRSTIIPEGANGYDNFGTIGIDRIKGKVILFTDLTDDLILQTNKLKNIINMSSKSIDRPYLKVYRYTEIIGKENRPDGPNGWQNNIVLCFPDLSNMCQRMDHTNNEDNNLGIQIFANCFQSESDELKAYIDYFKTKSSAFIKQKDVVVDLPLVINEAQDPITTSLPEQQCISLKEQWVTFNNLIDWDTEVSPGDGVKNIPANVCNACHLTTLASDGTTCIKK